MLDTALRQHWSLAIESQRLVQDGNDRQLWWVRTASGDVAVKCAPTAPIGLAAMEQLADAGFDNVPTLRRTTDGSSHATHDGHAIWVMDWVTRPSCSDAWIVTGVSHSTRTTVRL